MSTQVMDKVSEVQEQVIELLASIKEPVTQAVGTVVGLVTERVTDVPAVPFANEIPTGALLLVSDQPMVPEGVKTSASDAKVTGSFVESHVRLGIDSLREIINEGRSVKHLRFE